MPGSERERIIDAFLDCYVSCGKCDEDRRDSMEQSPLAHALCEEFDLSDIRDELEHEIVARRESGRLAKWVEGLVDNGLTLGMTPKQIFRYLLFMFVSPPNECTDEMLSDFEGTIPGL